VKPRDLAEKELSKRAEMDIERRLREAASEFIEAHRKAEVAIREAAMAGMPPEPIAHVSGLSPETVAAFLRLIATEDGVRATRT
jgi:hypothetical protein